MSLLRAARRVAATAGIAVAAVVAFALPAAAHVTIDPSSATPGGYGSFDVQVPNEETSADTTEVQLYLPADHPIASVSVRPVPGWKIAVVKGKPAKPIKTDDGVVTQVVTRITWSGGRIRPGEFERFGVALGPLPTGTKTLYFKALQTYTDASGRTDVVRWIDLPQGGAEPEHPAPAITLTPSSGPKAIEAAARSTGGGSGGDGTALGAAGLAAGLLALGAAVVALRRSGRATRSTAATRE